MEAAGPAKKLLFPSYRLDSGDSGFIKVMKDVYPEEYLQEHKYNNTHTT